MNAKRDLVLLVGLGVAKEGRHSGAETLWICDQVDFGQMVGVGTVWAETLSQLGSQEMSLCNIQPHC